MRAVLLVTPGRTGGSAFMAALGALDEVVCWPEWPHEERPAADLVMRLREIHAPEEPERARPMKGRIRLSAPAPASPPDATPRDPARGEGGPARLSVAARVDRFYQSLAVQESPGCAPRFFLEKTPYFARDAMLEFFPDAITFVLVRDPREAAISAVRFFGRQPGHRWLRGSGSPLENLLESRYGRFWSSLASLLSEYRRRAPIHLLRYEEMVEDAEAFFRRALGPLGLGSPDAVGACVEAFRRAGHRRSHATGPERGPSRGTWRSTVDDRGRAVLEVALAPVARELGYD